MVNKLYLKHLYVKSNHLAVLAIAIPMILSNITVPLLGIVDSAVIGHLENSGYLGGVAVGGTMINLILWLFGFLRMATTGITAQAFGSKNKRKQVQILLQALSMAILFSILILALSVPISHLILSYSDTSEVIKLYAGHYFLIRITSCPAALINLVIMGWLLGNHRAIKAMWLLIFTNLVNVILDLIFVPGFNMGVQGAALASVIADFLGLFLGIYFVIKTWKEIGLPKFKMRVHEIFEDVLNLVKLNLDVFIRSLFLQLVFIFMTFKGATFGDDIAAANAILMNFLMFISYVMDGFAYTMEALVGSSFGSKNKETLQRDLIIASFWSLVISILGTIVFALYGEAIIHFMTSIDDVRIESLYYLPWLIAFPLISMWSFLLDGVFVGATLGKEMRNGMILASAIFFIFYLSIYTYKNHALWASLLIFMLVRWVILATILYKKKVASTSSLIP